MRASGSCRSPIATSIFGSKHSTLSGWIRCPHRPVPLPPTTMADVARSASHGGVPDGVRPADAVDRCAVGARPRPSVNNAALSETGDRGCDCRAGGASRPAPKRNAPEFFDTPRWRAKQGREANRNMAFRGSVPVRWTSCGGSNGHRRSTGITSQKFRYGIFSTGHAV
jgi:hypothetical protein